MLHRRMKVETHLVYLETGPSQRAEVTSSRENHYPDELRKVLIKMPVQPGQQQNANDRTFGTGTQLQRALETGPT